MTDNTTPSGRSPNGPGRPVDKSYTDHPDETGDSPKGGVHGNVAPTPQATPKATKGQKHVSPPGRHSQQTHRRAAERAAAQGHATEQEQHAYDRSVVITERNRRFEQQEKQQQSKQNKRSGIQKATAPEPPQE